MIFIKAFPEMGKAFCPVKADGCFIKEIIKKCLYGNHKAMHLFRKEILENVKNSKMKKHKQCVYSFVSQ